MRKRVSHAGRVQARSLVVGGKSGSRDVGSTIPKAGLLEDRLTVSGGPVRTQREELQCQVSNGTSRVTDVQILKGSMVGRTGQGVRGCSTSMDRWQAGE